MLSSVTYAFETNNILKTRALAKTVQTFLNVEINNLLKTITIAKTLRILISTLKYVSAESAWSLHRLHWPGAAKTKGNHVCYVYLTS